MSTAGADIADELEEKGNTYHVVWCALPRHYLSHRGHIHERLVLHRRTRMRIKQMVVACYNVMCCSPNANGWGRNVRPVCGLFSDGYVRTVHESCPGQVT